ncbi:hypothetical protein SAMN05216350_103193 [Polaromonas sp. YR568]|uniref:hypothetical protein n=1 Tax=Polaromonas sp. YR568 TaxID=1855301 RepID=UPI0008F1AD0B|nr:hypothetical protein [Polaromonas sp. YR568]SFU62271.1 hypothetical protein SAMN05216350_103193 [Polaromonas sp. YR568]
MSTALTPRHLVLGLALCITLAATVWVSQSESEGDGPEPDVSAAARPERAPQASRREASADGTPVLLLDRLSRRAPAGPNQDAFAGRSWVAPPPPAAEAPPAAPSAPPLPFTYIGKMQQGETGPVTIHLMQGEQSYSVKKGDVIDKTYRVESIDTAHIVLTYLPLAIKQTLTFGNS